MPREGIAQIGSRGNPTRTMLNRLRTGGQTYRGGFRDDVLWQSQRSVQERLAVVHLHVDGVQSPLGPKVAAGLQRRRRRRSD